MNTPWWNDLNRFSFGDSPETANELAALALSGVKTGTSWLACEGEFTEVGQQHVLLNGVGHPVAVLETVELRRLPHLEVDAAFAYDSGEGERTLESWRADYQSVANRKGLFSEEMMMCCERFRLVERIVADESSST